jgi:hypothetical protein
MHCKCILFGLSPLYDLGVNLFKIQIGFLPFILYWTFITGMSGESSNLTETFGPLWQVVIINGGVLWLA